MYGVMLAALFFPADIPADQLQLLKVFRSEFIEITPGKGKFPASLLMGRAEGGKANQRLLCRGTGVLSESDGLDETGEADQAE